MCIIQMVRPDKFVLKLLGILKGRRQRRSPLAYPFDSIRSIVLELLDRCADRWPDWVWTRVQKQDEKQSEKQDGKQDEYQD